MRPTYLSRRNLFLTVTFGAIVLAAPAGKAAAQVPTSSFLEVGGGFDLGIPRGAFKLNVPQFGFGGSGYVAVRPAGGPLLLGGDLGFMIYGRESRREPFSTTIPDVTVRVVTSNNILMGHLFLRLQPPTGAVRPYIEGLIGFKYFWTETRIENISDPSEEPIARSTNQQDAAWSYGGGMGLAIQVWDATRARAKKGEGLVAVFVDLRLRLLLGSEAEYLKKGSIRRVGSEVRFDVQRSETDFLVPHIGVTVVF